jgi:predicted phage-related endonuclease
MAVTGLGRVDFAVLLGGQEYFEITVTRDEDLEHDVLDALAKFWRCVETNIAPAIDGSPGWGRYLATLSEVRTVKSVEATAEIDEMIARWREVRTAVGQLEAEDSLIRNRLLAYATSHRAKRIDSAHGAVSVIDSVNTSRGWETLAREYARQLGTDADADIEPHTRRKPIVFTRAPLGWSKES